MGANVSSSSKEATQISQTMIDTMVSSSNTCTIAATQQFIQVMQAKGNITISGQTVDLAAAQTISCLASQDMSSLMSSEFKSQLTSNMATQTAGIAVGLNVSAEKVSNQIVNNLTSKTNLSMIQSQAASAAQSMTQMLQAGGDISVLNQTFGQTVTQIIDGQAKQVDAVISGLATSGTTATTTTSIVDGMFSGSTYTNIMMFIALISIVGVIGGVIMAIVKSNKKTDTKQQSQQPLYPQQQVQYAIAQPQTQMFDYQQLAQQQMIDQQQIAQQQLAQQQLAQQQQEQQQIAQQQQEQIAQQQEQMRAQQQIPQQQYMFTQQQQEQMIAQQQQEQQQSMFRQQQEILAQQQQARFTSRFQFRN